MLLMIFKIVTDWYIWLIERLVSCYYYNLMIWWILIFKKYVMYLMLRRKTDAKMEIMNS